MPELDCVRVKVRFTCESVTLRQVLIVGWVVDIVLLVATERQNESKVRVMKVPKNSMLHARLILEAYHICVIADVARRRRLRPTGLWHVAKLVKRPLQAGLRLLAKVGTGNPYSDHRDASVKPLVIVPRSSVSRHRVLVPCAPGGRLGVPSKGTLLTAQRNVA